MSALSLSPGACLSDCFRADDTYIMPCPTTLTCPSTVSLELGPRRQQTEQVAQEPLERRKTVHFAGDIVLGSEENSKLVKKMVVNNNNKSGETGSIRSTTRSASRQTAPGAAKTDTSKPDSKDEHELTSVDRKWGVLFDTKGQPTARFVEAMGSLARYIVSRTTEQLMVHTQPYFWY